MTPVVKPRSAWTTTSRGGTRIISSNVKSITCHWPATPGQFGWETATEVAMRLRGWRKGHVNGRGWSDIGYNLGIDQAGRIWDLRGLYRIGAHAASSSNRYANHSRIGVLFIVGTDESPTGEMKEAFRYLRTVVVWGAHGSDVTGIEGHREVLGAQTKCPGNVIIGLKRELSLPWRLFEDVEFDVDESTFKNWVREAMRDEWDDAAKTTRGKYSQHGKRFREAVRDTVNVGILYRFLRKIRRTQREQS